MVKNRMKLHHHKYVLTLTVLFVGIIGIILGVQVGSSTNGDSALLTMLFGFALLLLVLGFVTVSILLRLREDMHVLHSELLACVNNTQEATTKVVKTSKKTVKKTRK